MIYEKPKNEIFASDAKDGEIVEFPNVKRGWGVTENLGFIPPMEYFNAAFNRVDKSLAYQLQRGVGEWDKDLEYPIGAIVSLNGIVYVAKSQNINKNPSENKEIWHVIASEEWCKQTCLNKGDYGLGGYVAPLISNLDDTTTLTGFYRADENQTSGTFPSAFGKSIHANVLVERLDRNWIKQTLTNIGTNTRTFIRTNNFSAKNWNDWQEVVTGAKDSTSSANSVVVRDANGDFAGRFISASHFRLRTQQQNNLFGESSEILFRGGASEDANYVRAVSGTYMLKALLSARGDGIFFQGVNENKGERGEDTFGYIRLPGGVLLQFGISHRMNPRETRVQYFPVAFPTRCLCVLVSAHKPIPNDGVNAPQFDSHDNAKFEIQNYDVNSSMHIAWMAIGV